MTTRRSETSQYSEEKKPYGIPLVAASEKGSAQTLYVSSLLALHTWCREALYEDQQSPRKVKKLFANGIGWKAKS